MLAALFQKLIKPVENQIETHEYFFFDEIMGF